MKRTSVANAEARFGACLEASAEGPVVITRKGKPVAILLAVDDEEELERLALAYSPRFQQILATSERQVRKGQRLRSEDFWREVEAQRSATPRRESKKQRVTKR